MDKREYEAIGLRIRTVQRSLGLVDKDVAEVEADPGTEKTRKELQERLEKKREEKKAEEKKAAEKAEEQKVQGRP